MGREDSARAVVDGAEDVGVREGLDDAAGALVAATRGDDVEGADEALDELRGGVAAAGGLAEAEVVREEDGADDGLDVPRVLGGGADAAGAGVEVRAVGAEAAGAGATG
ncbi:MAG: hypothetical protein Q8P41_03080, partial [Pseudomonadota bacterium]|nr:hypothetical protein [Pseudomonadota bacterium]